MVTVALYGVVPSLDDLSWRWEALRDGARPRDLLLCSLLPIPRRPSAVFVETNVNANTGYESTQNLNADVNDVSWYPTAPVAYHHEVSQSVATSIPTTVPQNPVSGVAVVSVATFDVSYDAYHHENFKPGDQSINMGMDYANVGNTAELYAEPPIKAQTQEYGMTKDASYYKYSESYAEVPEIDPKELDRAQSTTGSVYSTSSWESFADDSSRTTELSQEEIYEEIQREAAEIERRSSSPGSPSMKAPSSRKTSRSSRRMDDNDRKKELNRVAAAKYREKKRIEREHKLTELSGLEKHNQKLKSQHDKLENEIKYLKELIKEIRSRRDGV
uniref:BZIP domain-containing protein n=1 Tax=Panagrellus redivivus TaxID=6233 RepID=A0A7E4VRT6_PANRE